MMIRTASVGLTLLLVAFGSGNYIASDKSERIELRSSQDEPSIRVAITLSLRLLRKLPNEWQFELTSHNTGSEAVFIMTNPVTSKGLKSGYLALNKVEPSLLEISVRVQPPSSSYHIVTNSARVLLKRLDPGSSHTEVLTFAFPLTETIPPYESPAERKLIDPSNIKQVKAFMGILPDEQGVQDVVRRKERPYMRGLELVETGKFKGRSLYEVQTITCSSTVTL